MPEFRLNQPIETSEPRIEVTISENNPLLVGRVRFELMVTDDSGNESQPDVVEVIIADTQRPTAVLEAPEQVGFGQNFELSGERSTDIGGRIVAYRWTLIEAPQRPRRPPIVRPPINPDLRPRPDVPQ